MALHEISGAGVAERQRAYLVALELRGSRPLLSAEESLDELALLSDTAGLEVVGRAVQRVNRINPATFVGSGKAEEISLWLQELEAEVVIFDDELSPRHQRELEKIFGEGVLLLDRSALILDIFAQHARTREGMLQVELAQYEYRLPRLTRQWQHLARQAGGGAARGGAGGVGLRGPGETQLETDRREIGRRISALKRELENVRAHRARHRARRQRAGIAVAALVGYTNAGKSTLLNALSGADVLMADQLFATLDPTTRRVVLPGGNEMLVTDTVGFIQKLPHTLVAAFRATLEEIADADVLLHVIDASHANAREQADTVDDVLAELEVERIPRLVVLNKCDLPAVRVDALREVYPDAVAVSALKGDGLPELLHAIEDGVTTSMVSLAVFIPYKDARLLALYHEVGQVDEETHGESGIHVNGRLPARYAGQFRPYALSRPEN